MSKYILTLLIVLFLLPLTVSAAYNTVQFPQAANINIPTPNITLVVSANSNIAEMNVYLTYVSLTLEKDAVGTSIITLTSSNGYNLSNSASTAIICNGDGSSSITLAGPGTIGTNTVTITPQATNICLGVGTGTGGTSVPATTTGELTATYLGGGETTITTSEGTEATIKVPAYTVTTGTVFKVVSVETADVADVAAVPEGKTLVSAFDLTASLDGAEVSSFDKDITLTLTYIDSQIAGLDESTLKINRWNGSQWIVLPSEVDADANTITAATTAFSYFTIMGEDLTELPTKPIAEMTIEELEAEILRITALLAQVESELAKLIGVDALNTNLRYSNSSDDVKLLQTWLSKDPEVYPEGIVSGYFGSLTETAVLRFQEKYADEILKPLGLDKGTGFVGSSTRAKLNSLYNSQ